MIRKSATLIVMVIYFLTPYTIKNINVHCQCGCQEFVCYCCGNPENFGAVTSFCECKCNISDESYVQSPAIIAYSFEAGLILDKIGSVFCYNDDSILPGYKEPLMKPPPVPERYIQLLIWGGNATEVRIYHLLGNHLTHNHLRKGIG